MLADESERPSHRPRLDARLADTYLFQKYHVNSRLCVRHPCWVLVLQSGLEEAEHEKTIVFIWPILRNIFRTGEVLIRKLRKGDEWGLPNLWGYDEINLSCSFTISASGPCLELV